MPPQRLYYIVVARPIGGREQCDQNLVFVTLGLGRDKRRLETAWNKGSLRGVLQGILERCSSRDEDGGDFHSDSVQQAVAKSFKGKVYTKEHTVERYTALGW